MKRLTAALLLTFAGVVSSPVLAQGYSPGLNDLDSNPHPMKLQCWNGTAYAACPTPTGGSVSTPTNTRDAASGSVGQTAPTSAIQNGYSDPSGNLAAQKGDASGSAYTTDRNLNVAVGLSTDALYADPTGAADGSLKAINRGQFVQLVKSANALGAPSDAAGANTVIGQMKQNVANTAAGAKAHVSYTLSATSQVVLADVYSLDLPTSFNGATDTVTFTSPAGKQYAYSYTGRPTNSTGADAPPTFDVKAGTSVVNVVTGGTPSGPAFLNGGATAVAGTISVFDANNAPIPGAVAMTTAGTPYAAGRSVAAQCTAGGTVTWTMSDGSPLTTGVGVGWQSFPFAATAWALPSGSSASCTYSELK